MSESGPEKDALEHKISKEDNCPPQRDKQRGLFPWHRPRNDVDNVSQLVDGGREGDEMSRQRWRRRGDKVDECRRHGRREITDRRQLPGRSMRCYSSGSTQ